MDKTPQGTYPEIYSNDTDDDGMEMEDSLRERIEDWVKDFRAKRPGTALLLACILGSIPIWLLWRVAGLI